MWGQITGNQYLSQMFLKVGNKVITQGGKFVEKKSNTLTFNVDGDRFPKIFARSPFDGQLFKIASSSPNTVEINWGDGNVINYDFILYGGEYTFDLKRESAYIFEDGNTGFRNIVMTFKETRGIFEMNTLRCFLGETFPTNILAFTDLESIDLSQGVGVKNFPTKLSPVTKLTVFVLFSAEIDILPISLLNLPIENLRLVDAIDLDRPFNETNFDKINLLQNTLKSLSIERNNIDTFPSSFSELYKLEYLKTSFPTGGVLPAEIYNLPNLRRFEHGRSDGETLSSLDNFKFLTTLETLDIDTKGGRIFEPDVSEFGTLINLKNLTIEGSTQDLQTSIDLFINTLYSVVTNNGDIVSGSGPFREMAIVCLSDAGTSPTGIFQEPTGYIQNSNNGSPATPKEKIWVIVNQYNSTVNYSE
jgi:hypothetical protein